MNIQHCALVNVTTMSFNVWSLPAVYLSCWYMYNNGHTHTHTHTHTFQIVDSVSTPALLMLSRPTPCTTHTHPHIPHLITAPHFSHLPTPLDVYQSKAPDLVPWQSRYANHDSPFTLPTDNSWTTGSFIYASLACLTPPEQSLAQGELLGLSLLLEDVLQTSDLAKNAPSLQSVAFDASNIQMTSATSHTMLQPPPGASGNGGKLTRHASYEPSSGSAAVTVSRRTSHEQAYGLSKMGKRSSSSSLAVTAITSLHVLVPPLEGSQLMKQFLIKLSQLEILKLEWGKKMLRFYSVVSSEHMKLLESAYKDKVLSWVKKMVAKQQQRDIARMQAESVSFNETVNPHFCITWQICIMP